MPQPSRTDKEAKAAVALAVRAAKAAVALAVLVPVGMATVVLEELLRKATEMVELAEDLLLRAVLRLRRKVDRAAAPTAV